MNYIRFSFTLLMVVVSAFVMIYIVEGYYESRLTPASSASGVSIEAVRQQDSVLTRVKGLFKRAAAPAPEAPLDLSQKNEAEGSEVHHGLCVAAMTGDFEKTKLLLDAGVSANTRDAFGIRGITRATLWGHYEVVKLLLDRGASVNEKERLGVTLLMLAANQGDEKLLRLFLEKGAEVDARSEDGETALTTAARKGHSALVEILKEAGAEVPDDLELPEPVVRKEEQSENRSIAERLFSRDRRDSREHETGEEPSARSETAPMIPEHTTPGVPSAGELLNLPGEQPRALSSDALTWAANVSQASIQEKDVPLMPEDEEVYSPPRVSSEIQKVEVPRLELPKKTEASAPAFLPPSEEVKKIPSAQSMTLSESSPQVPSRPAVILPASPSKVKKVDLSTVPTEEEMLEEALLNLNRRRSDPVPESPPVQMPPAPAPAPVPVEKKTLQAVPERPQAALPPLPPSPRDDTGFVVSPRTAPVPAAKPPAAPAPKKAAAKKAAPQKAAISQDLLHATLVGDAARVRRLLEAGADVNVRGALEMTPLMIAAQDGNLMVVKTLLQKGAAVHAQNIVGQTALRLAMLRERDAVIAVLRSAGAVE